MIFKTRASTFWNHTSVMEGLRAETIFLAVEILEEVESLTSGLHSKAITASAIVIITVRSRYLCTVSVGGKQHLLAGNPRPVSVY